MRCDPADRALHEFVRTTIIKDDPVAATAMKDATIQARVTTARALASGGAVPTTTAAAKRKPETPAPAASASGGGGGGGGRGDASMTESIPPERKSARLEAKSKSTAAASGGGGGGGGADDTESDEAMSEGGGYFDAESAAPGDDSCDDEDESQTAALPASTVRRKSKFSDGIRNVWILQRNRTDRDRDRTSQCVAFLISCLFVFDGMFQILNGWMAAHSEHPYPVRLHLMYLCCSDVVTDVM